MQRSLAPSVPTGHFKTFGPFGPKYQVGEAVEQNLDGDWMVQVTIIESGDTALYPLRAINDDPEAH